MIKKVSDIVRDNDVAKQLYESKKEDTYKQPNLLLTGAAGTLSGLFATLPTVSGAVLSLPEIGYHSLKGLFDKDYPTWDKNLETLANSKLIKLGGMLDEGTKKLFGVDDITKLDKQHQAALMLGDWAPVIASGGSYGIIKAGQKGINKTARYAIKKAATKGLTGEAKKNFVKRRVITADTLMGLATPGVQISKSAGPVGKSIQTVLQTAPSLGMNEYLQAHNNNVGLFGDYRNQNIEPEKITLIKDKRKFKNTDEIPEKLMDNIEEYTIDPSIKEEESHLLRNALLGTAAVGAALTGTARYTSTGKQLVNDVLKKTTQQKYGYNSLDMLQKTNMTVYDRYAFANKMVQDGQSLPEDVNRFYMDLKSYHDSAYNTGKIGDIIDLSVRPVDIDINMKTLKETNEILYNDLEKYLEALRQVQDLSNIYNKMNDFNISTMQYLKDPKLKVDNIQTNLYNGVLSRSKTYDKLFEMQEYLNNNPLTHKILKDLSTLNKGLLKYRYLLGVDSLEDYKYAIKNRSFLGQILYKPGVEDISELSYTDRFVKNLFESNKKDHSLDYIENLTPRGIQNSINNAANLADILEGSFKQTIDTINKNATGLNFVKNSNKLLVEQANKTIKTFEDEVESVYKQKADILRDRIKYFKGKDPALYEKYTTELLEETKKFKDEVRTTAKDISSMIHIRKIGEADIRDTARNALDSVHDTATDISARKSFIGNSVKTYLRQSRPTTLGHLQKSSPRDGIYLGIENGRLQVWQMDPHFAYAMTMNPQIANKFTSMFYTSKNFLQSTITGKFAPWFDVRSNLMSTNEILLAEPKVMSDLGVQNVGYWKYIKEMGKNYKAMYNKYAAEQNALELKNQIAKLESNRYSYSLDPRSKYQINKAQIAVYQDRLQTILDTAANDPQIDLIGQLERHGMITSKPINVEGMKEFQLNPNFKETSKLKQQLINIHGFKKAQQVFNIIGMCRNLMRENPTLSLNTLAAKEVIKQRGLNTLNQKIADEIAKTINTQTANTVLRGTGEGFIGGASEFVRNYVPYGNILINSLAPKIIASGLGKGIRNTKQLGKMLLDSDVTYGDILHHMQTMAKEMGSNKYLKSLFFVSVMPSILQYVWNHQDQEHIDAYYSYSNYNKGSKLIFTDFFGKGNHFTVPLDQEVALSNAIVYSALDSVLGMSQYNELDPNFKSNKVIMEALGRSMGLDLQPITVMANLSGYSGSLNAFDDKSIFTPLPKDVINDDLSETAYENGIANQKATALFNSLMGTLGSAFLSMAEEGRVGSRNNTRFRDSLSAFIDKTFGTIGLVQTDATRNIGLTNDTIRDVYARREILKKIATVKTKNPQQQSAYDLIKMYNRNRIQPLKDQISLLRKDITHIKANTKTSDGQTQSFYSRKANINELTLELQKLYKLEFEEYNKLDNLLQQLYGKGITINTFMQQLYTGEQ